MQHFQLVAKGVPWNGIIAEVDAHPELWGSYDLRQRVPGSPHRDADDVWLRGPDPEEMARDNTVVARPHLSVFWPAWKLVPSLHPVVGSLMGIVGATGLGGILLTRIKPVQKVHWHTDQNYWHARAYNPKLYIPLRGNDGCVNLVEDEKLVMHPGEVWTFDNNKMHAVENNGDEDRIVAIVCTRTT